jgi:hypothetical protein
MATIDVASNSALLSVVEKLAEQNNILTNSAMTLKGNSVFVRYSVNADGTDFTESWSEGQDYIGIALGQNAPTEKSDYEWVLFKGATGEQGIQGIQGETGNSGVYVGAGDMPEDCNVQVDTEGDVIDLEVIKAEVTPVKGVDYSTAEDKQEIEDFIVTELAKRGQLNPKPAQSVEDMTDTSKIYVLCDKSSPDNGYFFAYGKYEKLVSENQFIVGESTLNARVRSNGEIQTGFNGSLATNLITIPEFVNPYTVKISGIDIVYNTSTQVRMGITYYDGTGAVLGGNASLGGLNGATIPKNERGEYVVDIYNSTYTTAKSCRFQISVANAAITSADVANLYIDFVPKNTVEIGHDWYNTGLNISPADYEPRIVKLEEDVDKAKIDIFYLQKDVEMLTDTSTNVAIPSYWKTMVENKSATVKALQTVGGKNCVSFVWAADTHIPDATGGQMRTNDIGKVMARMLDNCEIPFAVISGDINTRASFGTEAGLVEAQAQMPVHLAPLWGTERLLMALGNHDGCYGDSAGYYRKQFNPERMWQIFFRGQALDFRRVFSNDGSYFYVDNIAQKTRFIVLNSHFGGEYAVDGNGYAVNNRFSTSCYGQAQLDWLADVALDMPEGYGAIITAHVPPNISYTVDKEQFIGIVNAYNNKTTYSGSYTGVDGWTSNNVSVDFTKAKGEIIAMFTGHVHGDSIDTTTMDCPIVTILAAGSTANEPYAETAPTRTAGTDTETNFDVVTVNRATRKIYCTRVGAGTDREITY